MDALNTRNGSYARPMQTDSGYSSTDPMDTDSSLASSGSSFSQASAGSANSVSTASLIEASDNTPSIGTSSAASSANSSMRGPVEGRAHYQRTLSDSSFSLGADGDDERSVDSTDAQRPPRGTSQRDSGPRLRSRLQTAASSNASVGTATPSDLDSSVELDDASSHGDLDGYDTADSFIASEGSIDWLDEGLNRDSFINTAGGSEERAEQQWGEMSSHLNRAVEMVREIDRDEINQTVNEIMGNMSIDNGLKMRIVNAAHMLKTEITEFLDEVDRANDASDDPTPPDPMELQSIFDSKKQYDNLLVSIPKVSEHQAVGQSGAIRIAPEKIDTRFTDVAGIDEAKEELTDIVDFLRNPEKYHAVGAKQTKGVLLYGPPGNGKTLIARAIAGEAGVPFYSVSASSFVEMYVGVGASRVRELFNEAKKEDQAIIFIDEIDAVGRKRNASTDNTEHEQTLLEILAQMDGFTKDSNVIVIAATNRKDMLDDALIRPGRFDQSVMVSTPNIAGRRKILEQHLGTIQHTLADGQKEHVAQATLGFSGADMANVVERAARLAGKQGKPAADFADFQQACDTVQLGALNKTLTLTEEERRATSYHEAGHTVIAAALADDLSTPLHKVTIIPRSKALGVTMMLPGFKSR